MNKTLAYEHINDEINNIINKFLFQEVNDYVFHTMEQEINSYLKSLIYKNIIKNKNYKVDVNTVWNKYSYSEDMFERSDDLKSRIDVSILPTIELLPQIENIEIDFKY